MYSSNNGVANCSGTNPCAAVFQFSTSFAAGNTGSQTHLGASSAAPNPALRRRFRQRLRKLQQRDGHALCLWQDRGRSGVVSSAHRWGRDAAHGNGHFRSYYGGFDGALFPGHGCFESISWRRTSISQPAKQWTSDRLRSQWLPGELSGYALAGFDIVCCWPADPEQQSTHRSRNHCRYFWNHRAGLDHHERSDPYRRIGDLAGSGSLERSSTSELDEVATTYGANARIIDTNGNVEISSCVVRPVLSQPTWSPTLDANTLDGL